LADQDRGPPRDGLGGCLSPRGRDATYQVFDTTVPTSRRILYWMEPGTQVNGPTVGQVPYYFSASGFTEPEFFQLADSLLPV
jgi:hypothetical protein